MADSVTDVRAGRIKELVEEMKLYNNPQELEDIKKLIRKNVPLTMRGYFSAYMYILSGNSARPASKGKNINIEKKKVQIPENSSSLYVNIGKSAHVSSKELKEFIVEKASINEESIVSVVTKQNYSFVYVKKSVAKTILDSLAGTSIKGRKIKASYSKEKDAE